MQVAQACNLSYSGGRNREDRGLKPVWANSLRDPNSREPITKKGWWSGSRYRSRVQAPVPQTNKQKEAIQTNTISTESKWNRVSILLFPSGLRFFHPHHFPGFLNTCMEHRCVSHTVHWQRPTLPWCCLCQRPQPLVHVPITAVPPQLSPNQNTQHTSGGQAGIQVFICLPLDARYACTGLDCRLSFVHDCSAPRMANRKTTQQRRPVNVAGI
jgi:hypothetical protein